jgi:hypothetical protein
MSDVNQAKRSLVQAWKVLPEAERRTFLSRCAREGLEFVPPNEMERAAMAHPMVQAILETFPQAWVSQVRPSKEEREDAELEFILNLWPKVLEGDLDEASREFAQDVDKRRRWKRWHPSEKQRAWIVRIWAECIEDSPEVLEAPE